jgi:hypothetical protein
MYLPRDVRKRLSFEDGIVEVWSESDIATLASMGDALPIRGGEYHAPQHHARSFEQLLYILSGYEEIARDFRLHIAFRGQTRDYFDSAGNLTVLSGVERNSELARDYTLNGLKYRKALEPWLKVLNEHDIRTDTGVGFKHSLVLPNGSQAHGTVVVNHVVALLRSNLVVAAILQHYGFPTDHLDASTDLAVALWFALHKARNHDGRTLFDAVVPPRKVRRRKPLRASDAAGVPSLHVYLQRLSFVDDLRQDHPVIVLSQCRELTAVAKRPVRQSAISMPCGRFCMTPGSSQLPPRFVMAGPSRRWPAAVIKLYFPFDEVNRPDLTARKLFPTRERLYRALLKIGAPYLAIYA